MHIVYLLYEIAHEKLFLDYIKYRYVFEGKRLKVRNQPLSPIIQVLDAAFKIIQKHMFVSSVVIKA